MEIVNVQQHVKIVAEYIFIIMRIRIRIRITLKSKSFSLKKKKNFLAKTKKNLSNPSCK